jgi:hypothetical protein
MTSLLNKAKLPLKCSSDVVCQNGGTCENIDEFLVSIAVEPFSIKRRRFGDLPPTMSLLIENNLKFSSDITCSEALEKIYSENKAINCEDNLVRSYCFQECESIIRFIFLYNKYYYNIIIKLKNI